MSDSTNDVYSEALAKAKKELSGLRPEVDRIMKRIAMLEAYIANAETLIGPLVTGFKIEYAPGFVSEIPKMKIATPIWKSIIHSIGDKSESFSVRDALDGLERIGKGVASPNKFQIVRAVLTKKTQNFEQLGPGLFRVKSTDNEKEAPEETS